MKQRCPNCKAVYIGYNDHDLGEPTPNQWLCDTFRVEYEQPVINLTFQAGKLIQAFLRTHSDPSAKLLVDIFDNE